MNISFSLTIPQFRARTKTVTRRLGWFNAYRGQVLTACEKCQGLKRGEHVVTIGKIRLIDVRFEPLRRMLDDLEYGLAECKREGFPNLTPTQFIMMFCRHNKCRPTDMVARLQFQYLNCFHPGCNNQASDYVAVPEGPIQRWCDEHAHEGGFCFSCGSFEASHEEFETDPNHLCLECSYDWKHDNSDDETDPEPDDYPGDL